jgi:hypothetical protein
MAFSQSGIDDVRIIADGPDLFIAWSSSGPAGTIFQVYVNRRLAWYGAALRCHAPVPSGSVAPGGRSERAVLSWSGGTYLDPSGFGNIQGFQIYQSPAPGAAVDLITSVDSVTAYPGGWINDGFGKGDFGGGGFGRASTLYTWESGPLSSGVWQFAVLPIDKAGNVQAAGSTATVTINAAPRPPGLNAGGSRLTSTYAGPSNPQLTLNWLPSPSE